LIRLFAYFGRRRPDPIDALIAAKGARPRYSGFDPALRQRTNEKRREAEQLKRATRRQDAASEGEPARAHRRIQD
jgi:hypothetical protein